MNNRIYLIAIIALILIIFIVLEIQIFIKMNLFKINVICVLSVFIAIKKVNRV